MTNGKLVRDKIPEIILADGKNQLRQLRMQVRDAKREKRGGFEQKIFWSGNELCN